MSVEQAGKRERTRRQHTPTDSNLMLCCISTAQTALLKPYNSSSRASTAMQQSRNESLFCDGELSAELERRCADAKLAASKYVRKLGVGTVLIYNVEIELVGWINILRKDGAPVSSRMLAVHAQEATVEHDIDKFFASWHWQNRFKIRHHLSLRARTRQGQVPLQLRNDLEPRCAS